MKRYERDIEITRPPHAVFEFFADMTQLPRWAPEDFVSVERIERDDDGEVGLGTKFELVTKGASARATFAWDRFDPATRLEFSGPRLDVGPGWVEGKGGYRFEATEHGTRVSAWFEPTLGGFLRLMSPFARMRNVRLLGKQLARAKQLLEAA